MIGAWIILVILVSVGVLMMLIHHEVERDTTSRIVARIDEILPQTQCQQCEYAGCLPYARAIVANEASIDLCPPGGPAVRRSLAELLGRSPISGRRNADAISPRQVVFIDEPRCIGCTKCIQACPVDAIVGAAKQMHTVITELCTGCELCIAPCPVDCIEIEVGESGIDRWRWGMPPFTGRERRSTVE